MTDGFLRKVVTVEAFSLKGNEKLPLLDAAGVCGDAAKRPFRVSLKEAASSGLQNFLNVKGCHKQRVDHQKEWSGL